MRAESEGIPTRGGRRYRMILWLLIAGIAVWHLNNLRAAVRVGTIPMYDVIEYWAAGRVLLSGGNPYGAADLLAVHREAAWADERPIRMWNPPWVLPLVLPFAILPYWWGRAAWCLVHLLVIVGSADWLWRTAGGPMSRRWIGWLGALFYIPSVMALFLGQISPLMLAGIVGFLWSIQENRQARAGIFTLLIAVKPHVLHLFWIFLLLWSWKERKLHVLFASAAAILLSTLAAILMDASILRQYIEALRSEAGPQIWHTPTWGVALYVMAPQLGKWVRFIPTGVGAFVALALWRRWRDTFDWQRCLPPILLLSIITSSFTWMFDWVVLIPVLVVILVSLWNSPPSRRWWLIAGLLAIEAGLIVQPAFARSNFYTIWMPLALALVYLRRRAPEAALRRPAS